MDVIKIKDIEAAKKLARVLRTDRRVPLKEQDAGHTQVT